MAVWIPVTVVPRSLATDLIETFMTELSRVMRNWLEASRSSTGDRPPDVVGAAVTSPPPDPRVLIGANLVRRQPGRAGPISLLGGCVRWSRPLRAARPAHGGRRHGRLGAWPVRHWTGRTSRRHRARSR